ncbi:MAG: hypothetical protein H6702_24500 [Myxococcales bacterium]|nr:hypothetical protein [Myxococcales bacterium]
MRHLTLGVLALLALVPAGSAWADAPDPDSLRLDAAQPAQSLDGRWLVVEGSGDDLLPVDEAGGVQDSLAWRPAGPGVFSRQPDAAPVWLRADVVNPTDQPIERLWVLRFALIDQVVLAAVYPDGRVDRVRAGEDVPLAHRRVPHRLPVLPITVPPGQTVRLYAHLADPGAIDAPMLLCTWPWLAKAEARRDLIHGLFMGSLLVLMLFATGLAVARRERLYGWFAGYLGSVLLSCLVYFWAGAAPWLAERWGPDAVNRGIVVTAVLVFMASIGFAARLLDLDQHRPRVHRWLSRVLWAYPVGMVAAATLPYGVAVALSAVSMLPVLVPVGVSVRLAGAQRVAALYALSWAVLIGAVAAVYLRVAGLVPADFPTAWFLYVGFFLQFVVLVVAMAGRVRAIERERRAALQAEIAAYQRNAALARSFERFVPKAFLDRLQRTSYTEIELGHAVSKRMTILFSDIRSFTSLVEAMSPEENFAFINEYLGYMEPAIHQHLGFIDKYIGDAVMALFDDERDDGAGARRAVQSAVGMHSALARYNRLRAERREPPVGMGIGLHTGELMLGTIGGRDRLNASVIGDSVNLASRVEGLTKRYGAACLVSGEVVAQLGPDPEWALRHLDDVRVKGRSSPVAVYQLLDCEPRDERAARLLHRDAWHAARGALVAGRLDEALARFQALAAGDPGDKAVPLMIARCERLLAQGLPEGWDGAETWAEK